MFFRAISLIPRRREACLSPPCPSFTDSGFIFLGRSEPRSTARWFAARGNAIKGGNAFLFFRAISLIPRRREACLSHSTPCPIFCIANNSTEKSPLCKGRCLDLSRQKGCNYVILYKIFTYIKRPLRLVSVNFAEPPTLTQGRLFRINTVRWQE